MEAAKKQRKVVRAAFTRACNELKQCLDEDKPLDDVLVAFEFLETKYSSLTGVHADFHSLIYESKFSEDEISAEIQTDDEYTKSFIAAKRRVTKLIQAEENARAAMNTTLNATSSQSAPAPAPTPSTLKLPKMEFPKFSGSVKEWLPFWSVFQKIHEDSGISLEDKLHYLLLSTTEGSRARDLVSSFPPVAKNYKEAFEALKNRFGRDDIVIEHYVRELLGLVLQNATRDSQKAALASISDKLGTYVRALNSLGVTADKYAAMLYPLVESSLPEDVLRAWQRSGFQKVDAATDESGNQNNRLDKLLEFLRNEVENQERIDMALKGFGLPKAAPSSRKQPPFQQQQQQQRSRDAVKEESSASALLTARTEKSVVCVFCASEHDSEVCEKARAMSLEERKECVRNANACLNCMKRGHIARRCRVKSNCAWCGSKRHVLFMCGDVGAKPSLPQASSDCKPKSLAIDGEANLATLSHAPKVCLQTLRVVLYSDSGEKIVRAIIDSASMRSYVRTAVAREIGYAAHNELTLSHSLFGGVRAASKKHNVFKLHMANLDRSFACNFDALEQEVICDSIPCIAHHAWVEDLRNDGIVLTDVDDQRRPIDVLIGADVAGKLLTGRKRDIENGVTVFETLLGWTVMGKMQADIAEPVDRNVNPVLLTHEMDVSQLWELDVLGISDPIAKVDKALRDQHTRDFIVDTMQFSDEKRFVVRLPWKNDHAPLQHNFEIAQKRLRSTISKLENSGLLAGYSSVFDSWREDGIIERVPYTENHENCHYLPHRAVVKENSTTPIRPVFDASARTPGNPSLNDCLEVGPNLIELIPSALNRFREKRIGVISDIKAAFLQICVAEEDRDLLRFLWSERGKVVVYRHCRIVFGLTCSPFLLAIVLMMLLAKLLARLRDMIPNGGVSSLPWSEETIEKLKKSFYVDNCVTSVESASELQIFMKEATAALGEGSFNLRGWEYTGDGLSNKTALVLGLNWDKSRDCLYVNIPTENKDLPRVVTKRAILSFAHKIFDPVGFTCPTTLQPKLLLAKLWHDKVDWDTPVDDAKKSEFLSWVRELESLREIAIPRYIGPGRITIHAFGDASKYAYAAVVFARVENGEDVTVHLMSARARIAPKNATVPRLELLAALIAARLADAVIRSLTREVEKLYLWSDSTTVLAWRENEGALGTFPFRRVKEINKLTEGGVWGYLPSELNPADLPSRGCSPRALYDSQWWFGPGWLHGPKSAWPNGCGSKDESEIASGFRKCKTVAMTNVPKVPFDASKMFSSYSQLLRFLAWTRRFLANCRSRIAAKKANQGQLICEQTETRFLSFNEVRSAEIVLMKHLQATMFGNSVNDKLSSFKTMRDSNGLIVVQTSISNRRDDCHFLYPILLDKHEIVNMLIRELHERCGHLGTQVVMSALREKFWLISARNCIKSVLRSCVACKKQHVKRMECETPALPPERIRDAKVFEITGVDFAGPLYVKGGGKAWICLFTCAVYRAVHLELAPSMSAEAFLECLRRFIARRGRIKIMFCDNGTNFVGVHNLLKELDWDVITKQASLHEIEWRFSPPSAPWWGGWWERLVGVVKSILKKVLGKAYLTYESLTTTLCDAEAAINSRPLTYLSDDPDDLRPLTPAMFLQELPESGVTDLDMINCTKLNKKYVRRQQVRENLRVRFRNEYLSQLRLKNSKIEPRSVRVGDIVLIGDDNVKRVSWPLARVIEEIVGRDGKSRVFVLKTRKGVLKRPIQRLYPLEISDLPSDNGLNDSKIVNEVSCTASQNDRSSCNDVTTATTTRSGRIVRPPLRLRTLE